MATFVFDLDGTIVDSGRGIFASLRHTLQTRGMVMPNEAELRWVIGPPLRTTLAKLAGDAVDVEEVVATYREHYACEGIFGSDPYPGIADQIAQLRAAGHTLFVCTSKLKLFADAILDRISLTHVFTAIYGAEQGGAGDHKPELLARLIAEHRVEPTTAVMIGDRREDIIAGKANGMATLGVLWGYGDAEELTAAGASAICPHVSELATVLERERP